ncbi:MAG: hypothetical protein KIS81_06540 [Maricaulaceae bacterium]|nr:hypothetical protein [Maricaulaceae bacterium]
MRLLIAAIAAGGAAIAALYYAGPYIGTQEEGANYAAETPDIGTEEEGAHAIGTEELGANAAAIGTEEFGAHRTESGQFVNTASADFHGYYMPAGGPVAAGGWRLHHLFIGHAQDFAAFDAAGQPAGEAPVWIEFWHPESEIGVNELGQEYAHDSRRVRADSYAIADGAFEFRARHADVGEVLLSGMIDPAQIQGPVEGTTGVPALTGGLEVNGERIRNVSFHHWYGD